MEATLTKSGGSYTMSRPFDLMVQVLLNGTYTVKITRKTRPRTVPQNSLMWMWYKCMEDATGTPKDVFHDYYKRRYLTRRVAVGGSGKLIEASGSTASLTTAAFSEYLEKVKADAASEFGIDLPLPEDRYYQDFVDEYRDR